MPIPVVGTTSLTATGQATHTKNNIDNVTTCEIYGTYGTVQFAFEGTTDGTNWSPLAAEATGTMTIDTGTLSPSDNSVRTWRMLTAGLTGVRANVSAIASGTVSFAFRSQQGTHIPPAVVNTSATALAGNLSSTGSVLSSSASGGVGYATGAGGTVTQATSRATGVTLNKVTGNIVLFSAAGSATPFSFTLTNSAIAAGDTVVLSQKSGTDKYTTQVVTAVAAGSCQITLANASGTTTEQPVFNFCVIKGVAA